MAIEQLSPDHPLWPHFVAHLEQHNMAQWVLRTAAQPLPGLYLLATVVCDECEDIAGHITLKMQRLAVPGPAETDAHPLSDPTSRPLRELFVQTFAVNEDYRRQGHGRALQCAALDMARRLRCYQMRSWSSLDKAANYALKLSMGFAAHPAIQHTADGTPISGVYFVKTIAYRGTPHANPHAS